MKIKGFIIHKKAEGYEDCQDYFAINKDKGCLAISDGMSQSIFPQWWAEELVRAYVDNAWIPNQNDLKSLREKWLNRVCEFLELQKQEGKPTWMLENCLIEKRGAGATFCGICFENETNWKGYVLGDSCLIEVASNDIIIKFERTKEGVFDNNPDYFDSFVGGKGNIKNIQGSLEEGSKLLLVTDALAEFLYVQKEKENEAKYVRQLLQLESHDNFCRLIEDWRESENLHNDDTTLLIVEYDGCESFNITIEDNLNNLCEKEQKETINSTNKEVETNTNSKEEIKNEKSSLEILYNLIEEIEALIQKRLDRNKLKKNLNNKIRQTKELINKLMRDGKTPQM